MSAIDEVRAERDRQILHEGFDADHDDMHDQGELARAAGCYALYAGGQREASMQLSPRGWPWEAQWWKPKNPRRDLIRAAALIIAEIERLDRADLVQRGIFLYNFRHAGRRRDD